MSITTTTMDTGKGRRLKFIPDSLLPPKKRKLVRESSKELTLSLPIFSPPKKRNSSDKSEPVIEDDISGYWTDPWSDDEESEPLIEDQVRESNPEPLSSVNLWSIRKELKASDIGNNCRLLISEDLVDAYVTPFLDDDDKEKLKTREGLDVCLWDSDTGSEHHMVLKKWFTWNRNYVFNKKWKSDFVKRRNLKAGDEIGMFWDSELRRFHFSVLGRSGKN